MPASAVSIGNVTCFSISTGLRDAAVALICTWRLVMSGTASIGRSRSAITPSTAAAATIATTAMR